MRARQHQTPASAPPSLLPTRSPCFLPVPPAAVVVVDFLPNASARLPPGFAIQRAQAAAAVSLPATPVPCFMSCLVALGQC